jgi:hypothetical protein
MDKCGKQKEKLTSYVIFNMNSRMACHHTDLTDLSHSDSKPRPKNYLGAV